MWLRRSRVTNTLLLQNHHRFTLNRLLCMTHRLARRQLRYFSSIFDRLRSSLLDSPSSKKPGKQEKPLSPPEQDDLYTHVNQQFLDRFKRNDLDMDDTWENYSAIVDNSLKTIQMTVYEQRKVAHLVSRIKSSHPSLQLDIVEHVMSKISSVSKLSLSDYRVLIRMYAREV